MSIYEISLIIVATINLGLGAVVYLSNIKSRTNRSYASFVISAAVWSVGLVLFSLTDDLLTATIWLKIYYIAAALIAANFLYFAIVFPEEKIIKFKHKFLIYIPSVLFVSALFFFNKFLAFEIKMADWGKDVILGIVEYSAYGIYFIIYILAAYYVLINKLLRAQGVTRVQLYYIIWGTLFGFLWGMYFNLILPWVGNYQHILIGPLMSIVMVAAIAYAIAKHHLMNIKVIATELFAGLIALVALLDTLLTSDPQNLYYKVPILVGTIVFAVLIVRSVLREVEIRERVEKLAKDLEFANSRLEKLLKMKSEFLNLVSHQLRTPLTAVVGFLEWWKTGEIKKFSEEKQQGMMKNVIDSADRLKNTVEDILTVLKVQGETQYKFEPIDLAKSVKEAVELVKPIYDMKKLTLEFKEPPANLPQIVADAKFLKQVWINLIDNAAKYTESGGTVVSISVHSASEAQYNKFMSVIDSQDAKDKKQNTNNHGENGIVKRWVQVSVKDTGIGLDEEDKQRLFKQFSRGLQANKMNTTGSGLGLYLVKEIIDAHKGAVEVKSEGKGKGSEFTVKLGV